jgi:molecular chaperone DnaK
MTRERVVVGIDLGTTFTAIARVNAYGKPEIIPNLMGDRTTPSVIYFEPGVAPLIGRSAKEMRAQDPQRVVEFIKREMGNAHYIFLPDPHGSAEDSYTAEELSALILQKLKLDAEQAIGQIITDAVITVPAYFRDSQRQATLYAGQMAGLNVLEIINEPTAAALAYGFNRRGRKERILVYDLGGGTFDVTLLEIDHDEFRVVASDGNSNLGGKDFDDRLINFMRNEFKLQTGVELSDDDVELTGELRDRAERAKVRLSELRSVTERISWHGKSAEIELSRERFEKLVEDLVAQTEDLVTFVLLEAKCTWPQVDEVILVGGSTRMPFIGEMLERLMGKPPSRAINPDEAVALGAALRGWFITSPAADVVRTGAAATSDPASASAGAAQATQGPRLPAPPPIVVKDAAPHSLGVITLDASGRAYNTVVLRKNTEIPCSVSRDFPTAQDDQTYVLVNVTQGEDVDLDYCIVVGDFMLGPIPARPRGETRIEVIFSYDKNGSVSVRARDKATGQAVVSEIASHALKGAPEELARQQARISGLAREDN